MGQTWRFAWFCLASVPCNCSYFSLFFISKNRQAAASAGGLLDQSEGGETPRTAYAIPGRVGYGGGSCRRVRRRFRFRRSWRVGRGRPRGPCVPMGPRAGRDPPAGNDNKNNGHGDTSRPHSQRARGSHTPCGAVPPPHSDPIFSTQTFRKSAFLP